MKTGVVDVIGRRLHRISGGDEFRLTALIMFTAAACASVMKNTTTTAMFVPVVLGLAERARVRPSKLLMPLAFGAILGGTCTLIGTSTNLAVSGALARLGDSPELAARLADSPQLLARFGPPQALFEPFSMFELTPVGIAIVVAGMLYMLLLGLRLLPARGGGDASLVEQYQIREYVSEVIVLPDSPLVGKTLAEANLSETLDLTVIGIIRGMQGRTAPRAEETIQAGDLLLVQGRVEDILRVKTRGGHRDQARLRAQPPRPRSRATWSCFEVMVLRGSDLNGRTLRGLNFRDRYDLTVLAINRHGVALLSKLSSVTLRFGDVLLVQGSRESVERLASGGEPPAARRGFRAARARGQTRLGRRGLPALHPPLDHASSVPLSVAVLLGVLLLLATRAVRTQEIYGLIDWRLIVLIAGMISFGTAMEKTHADQFLADLIVQLLRSLRRDGGARGLLRADGRAHAADVEPGRRARRPAHRRQDRARCSASTRAPSPSPSPTPPRAPS